MGATPFLISNYSSMSKCLLVHKCDIAVQAKAYLRASAMLRLGITIY